MRAADDEAADGGVKGRPPETPAELRAASWWSALKRTATGFRDDNLTDWGAALLYWAAPNVKHPKFRWVSPGGVLAVIGWVIASAAFALYVANFGSYNKTYGALAGPIVFLLWLWISNIMVLLGAEFNAELQRGRAIEAGHPEHEEPFVEPRDTRKMSDAN